MPMLVFTHIGNEVFIGGKTFLIKDRLKEIAYWNPRLSRWNLPGWNDFPERRQELEALATQKATQEKAESKVARLYAKSPEGKAAAAAEEKLRIKAAVAAGSSWICCNDCQVIDWVRKHTSCQACAVDGNTFFVNGILRTGD